MIIYLARHGETTGDIEGRYGGDYDDHLTGEGRQQALKLAEQLRGKGIKKLFTSPKIRAQETATAVGDKLGLEAIVLDDFRERNRYGVLTGLLKDEAKQQHPSQVEAVKDLHAAIEGAEEYSLFRSRITGALSALIGEDIDTVAVVTHGGPFKLIFEEILHQGNVEVADCAYVALKVENGQYELVESNGVTKL